jgi:hypothetical protein
MKADFFKIDDRVFHYSNGWGTITKIIFEDGYKLIQVDFDNRVVNSFTYNHIKLLSFTEYTLQGFTQERQVELPEVGELCLVRDYEIFIWKVREFAFEHNGTFYVKEPCGSTDGYDYMKRIKILD